MVDPTPLLSLCNKFEIIHLLINSNISVVIKIRGGSRTAATPKMQLFVIIVNGR